MASARGQCVTTVNAGEIRANGRLIDRNATVQAKAQARWLYNFFGECDIKKFVQPVVVFPGWYVEKFDMKAAGVWVLEPKSLEAFWNSSRIISHRTPFERWPRHLAVSYGRVTALSSEIAAKFPR